MGILTLMFEAIRTFTTGRRVLRELRTTQHELHLLRVGVERLADTLARLVPVPTPMVSSDVDVSYADIQSQAEFVDIETRLTTARGLPPTEDEILAEFERRHATETVL